MDTLQPLRTENVLHEQQPWRYKMNMNEDQSEMPRPSNLTLAVVVFVTIFAALAIIIGFLAFQAARQNQAGDLIRVPDDYATIQAAIDAANPGDMIQVRAGVYNENLTLYKPVSLVAETFDQINPANNQTIIDGGGGATTILIPPDLTQMPVVRGFVIRNAMDGIQASSEFIVEFNFLHSAINLISYQTGGGGFNRNNIYFKAGSNAIRLDNSDRPILIENNRIMYSGESGIEISLQNMNIPPALVEIHIWNNMILGNREDGIQLIDHAGDPQDTQRRFVITGNLIANNNKAGIGLMPNANTLEDYSGADVVEAVRVFNNTFYGNDYGISGGDNLVAFNNIIVNSINIGVWKVQGPAGANSVVAYTLFHNNGHLEADQSTIGAGILTGLDPLFVAAPNPGADGAWETVDDDFSGLVLQSTSPAIDKGVTQYIATNGEPVPLNPITGYAGGAPDLGWREFGAPIFMTPTPTPVASFTPFTPASPTPLTATSTPGLPTALPTITPAPVSPTVVTPTVTVTATTPVQVTVQSVTPNTALANTTVVLTIIGSGFQNGAVVAFEGGLGLPQEVVAVQVLNPTTLAVTVTARNDGSLGTQVWDIRVTNPDSSSAVLLDAFTVVPAP
jgi:hypothetical protein